MEEDSLMYFSDALSEMGMDTCDACERIVPYKQMKIIPIMEDNHVKTSWHVCTDCYNEITEE